MSGGNKNTSAVGVYLLTVTALWIAMLLLKVAGVLPISWLAVALGIFWIPASVVAITLLLALVIITASDLHRWNRTRRVMNRIRKDFNLLARGEVLDKIAVKYGLSRAPEETDKELRERILKFIKQPRKPKGGTANGL